MNKDQNRKSIEIYLSEHSAKVFYTILIFIIIIFSSYLYLNQSNIDIKDYSLDRNIEDNFVLPPQEDEKYLHYKEGNNITVINYYSLDCPYCRKLYFQEKNLIKEFGDKLNFAYRDKPLNSNRLSYEKALIKECIYLKNIGNKQEADKKYFEFTEEIFRTYEDKGNNLANNDWVKVKAMAYLTKGELNNCVNDESLKQKILGFKYKADASQIVWTPTIVIFKDGVEVERVEKVWFEIYKKVLQKYSENYNQQRL